MQDDKTTIYILHHDETSVRLEITSTTVGWKYFADKYKGTSIIGWASDNCIISCDRDALVRKAREFKRAWIKNAENRIEQLKDLEVE